MNNRPDRSETTREDLIGTGIIQCCPECGLPLEGVAINIHGSLPYIRHINVSGNIRGAIRRSAGNSEKLAVELTNMIVGQEFPVEEIGDILECISIYQPTPIPTEVVEAIRVRLNV